jgi:hypothetical protein
MGCAFGGILGMVEENFPTLFLQGLGMGLVFVFAMIFGAKEWLSSLQSQNSS